jgi:hypothetical protein
MAKQFWKVFYKRDTQEFEILGPSYSDEDFTHKVHDMWKVGISVNCNTIPIENRTRQEIISNMQQQGYKHVAGLFRATYNNFNNET